MTIMPFMFGSLVHRFPANRTPFRASLIDPTSGTVKIYGDKYHVRDREQSRSLRILVHGISSTPRSPYLAPHIHAALGNGHDVLSLALRGALGRGHDHYHAGLTDELHAILADPQLSTYEEITILGCSLGGLVGLNFACECLDSRVKAVAAVCPPVRIDRVQAHLDRPSQAIYRHAILSSLKVPYRKLWYTAKKIGTPLKSELKTVLLVRSFDGWDREVVLPRFGFSSMSEYHERVSISPARLKTLKMPAYLLFDQDDPMVPIQQMEMEEGTHPSGYTVGISSGGGHLSFIKKLDLGFTAPVGVAPQLDAWFSSIT